jgi:hypothetical protein
VNRTALRRLTPTGDFVAAATFCATTFVGVLRGVTTATSSFSRRFEGTIATVSSLSRRFEGGVATTSSFSRRFDVGVSSSSLSGPLKDRFLPRGFFVDFLSDTVGSVLKRRAEKRLLKGMSDFSLTFNLKAYQCRQLVYLIIGSVF